MLYWFLPCVWNWDFLGICFDVMLCVYETFLDFILIFGNSARERNGISRLNVSSPKSNHWLCSSFKKLDQWDWFSVKEKEEIFLKINSGGNEKSENSDKLQLSTLLDYIPFYIQIYFVVGFYFILATSWLVLRVQKYLVILDTGYWLHLIFNKQPYSMTLHSPTLISSCIYPIVVG